MSVLTIRKKEGKLGKTLFVNGTKQVREHDCNYVWIHYLEPDMLIACFHLINPDL